MKLSERFSTVSWVCLAALSATAVSTGCGASDSPGSGSGTGGGGQSGTSQGSGGQLGSGGQRSGSGGSSSATTSKGSGGSSASTGSSGQGGTSQSSTGSTVGSGGSSSSTSVGSGGSKGSGGAAGSGGSTGAGGKSGGATGSGGSSTAQSGTGAGGSTGSGGSTGTFTGTKTPGTAQSGDITVDPAKTYQVIDGFGIADVWQNKADSTAARLKLLFDPDQGIGLSILRVGIDTDGKIMGDAGFVDGPEVVKHGGKVWAAPWSPPANLKDNSNINNGGHLNTSGYDTWANTLAAFPAYYKQQSGVDLYAISAQNEPDYVASYKSCIFSASQMVAFIKVLGPKLEALTPAVHLLAAEPDVWSHTWNDGDKYGVAITGDATASSLTTIIATHDYGSNYKSYTRPSIPAGVTQHVWETEATYANGSSLSAGLECARGIFSAVTGGGANGWHYWWTEAFMDGGSDSNPPKRVYATGNFSKFVRPGYVRVDTTGVPTSLHIVSFSNPSDGTVAIVVLNDGSSAVQASYFVSGAGWPSTVTPYVTSASSNLAAGTAITVTAGRFSASVDGQSVTTFVGKQ